MLVKIGMTTLILGIVFGYLGMHIYGANYFKKGEVLSYEIIGRESVSSTPTLTPTSTPTLTPTPTCKPTPTPKPSPTPILQKKLTQEEIHGLIERFAGQYAVDPNVLRHIVSCESGFNQFAVNGKYLGLFQFSSNTWKKYRLSIGEDPDPNLRFNAEEAVQTGAYALSQGRVDIWPNCKP